MLVFFCSLLSEEEAFLLDDEDDDFCLYPKLSEFVSQSWPMMVVGATALRFMPRRFSHARQSARRRAEYFTLDIEELRSHAHKFLKLKKHVFPDFSS